MRNWFDEARLGVVIHWSHCSQKGWEIGWPMMGGLPNLPFCQSISPEEYNRDALAFNPTAYDPVDLARRIRRMGARYVVFPAKHLDGFAMYPTKLSDWSVAKSAYGRDLVGPFLEAARAEGLRVGLSFSLCDWHHPDYPTFHYQGKPYDAFSYWLNTPTEPWERYLQFLNGQMQEILSWYGPIDLIWFDGQWEVAPWKWRPLALRKLIRSLQPEILINDRLPLAGGFLTSERFVPAHVPDYAWEACLTMNESWGYNPMDTRYKSSQLLVQTLSEVAAKGGNLLLNISPTGEGTLPPEQVERMEAVGAWMAKNGESIASSHTGLFAWQFYGPTTRKGQRTYLHLVMRPDETVTVRGVKVDRLKAARVLGTDGELAWEKHLPVADILLQKKDPFGEVSLQVPKEMLDPLVTVIALDFSSEETPRASGVEPGARRSKGTGSPRGGG